MKNKLLLSLIVFTFVFLVSMGITFNNEVYAASDNLTDAQREEFYTYTDCSYSGQDGLSVGIHGNGDDDKSFIYQLNKIGGGGSYTTTAVDSSGNTYTWKDGQPLPNPCPKGEFKGKKVISMNRMFSGLFTVKRLDLSSFDTSQVMDMQNMFSTMDSLTDIDLTGFDTSKVTDMKWIFVACRSLSNLDLSGFNTSNVTDMSNMFDSCEKLSSLDITSFDTSKVRNMSLMFSRTALTDLDLSHFDTSNVRDMSSMFATCEELTSVNVSDFDTSKVTNMYGMFGECPKLSLVNLMNFDTSNVTDMSFMFYGDSSLKRVNLFNFTLKESVNISSMFEDAGKRIDDKPALGIVRSKESETAFNDSIKTGINNDNLMFNIHYSLLYDSNGGSGILNDENSPYMAESKVTVIKNTFTPVRGKEFKEWNTKRDGSGISYKAGDIFYIYDDITLYAQWQDIKRDNDKNSPQNGSSNEDNSDKKIGNSYSSDNKYGAKTNLNTPDTSDNNSLSLWFGLTALMGAGMIITGIYIKKRK